MIIEQSTLHTNDCQATQDVISIFHTVVRKKVEPRPLQDEDASSGSIDRIKTPTNRCNGGEWPNSFELLLADYHTRAVFS